MKVWFVIVAVLLYLGLSVGRWAPAVLTAFR